MGSVSCHIGVFSPAWLCVHSNDTEPRDSGCQMEDWAHYAGITQKSPEWGRVLELYRGELR